MRDINGVEIMAGMSVKTKFLGKDVWSRDHYVNVNDYDTFLVKQKAEGTLYVEKEGYTIPLRENDRTIEVLV